MSEELNFRVTPPKNWTRMDSEKQLFKRIYKDSANAKLENSKKINQSFKVFDCYLKYADPNRYGTNPTIQIQIHDNPDIYFDEFFETVENKIDWYSKNLKGFKLLETPKKILIDDVECVYFSISHLQMIDSVEVTTRSEVCMIPNGETLYQATFNDGESEDCTREFHTAIKSIKLR